MIKQDNSKVDNNFFICISFAFFSELSKQFLFGKVIHVGTLLLQLYNIKKTHTLSLNPDTPMSDARLHEYTYPLDNETSLYVQRHIAVDPSVIRVIPAFDFEKLNAGINNQDFCKIPFESYIEQDFAKNNTIYIREKIFNLLKSSDEKQRYIALAVILHENNHIKHGDADTALVTQNMMINHIVAVGVMFICWYSFFCIYKKIFAITPIVEKTGYVVSGLKGFFTGLLQCFISDFSFKQIKKYQESRADIITHADPTKEYKLLCGLESYLDEKKMDQFLEKEVGLSVWFVKLFKIITTIVGDHPSNQSRLKAIQKQKIKLIQKNPNIIMP